MRRRIIVPEEIPATAKFNGIGDYDVQELKLERHNIRFRLAEYVREDGTTLVGASSRRSIVRGHLRPVAGGLHPVSALSMSGVPKPLIYEQLREWGIDISTGQLHRLLCENQGDRFRTGTAAGAAGGVRDGDLCPHR